MGLNPADACGRSEALTRRMPAATEQSGVRAWPPSRCHSSLERSSNQTCKLGSIMKNHRDGCTPSKPPTSGRIWHWGGVAAALVVSGTSLLTPGMVQADDDEGGRRSSSLTINTPEWRSSRNRLEVSGRGTSRETVTVVNAYDPSQVLGSDDISRRSNRWSIRDYRPSPVPCRIRATQSDGQVAEREVSGAPDNCAPKTPGAGNTAPTANANGPYPGTAGQAVSFSSAGSIDPDGTIDSYSWSFGDGSSSSQANPNHSYASADTYTVTLTVTDNNGATGSNSTSATITTQSPANQPPTANAGPNQTVTLPPGFTNMPVTLNGGGSSDTDGTVTGWIWTGTPDPDDEVSPTVMLGEGTHSFSLVVTDNGGGNSEAAEVSITVNPPMIGGDPHATITAYNGPSTCVACHESEAQAMHGSVHYQQSGPTDYATNIPGPAGERWNGVPGEGFSGINTYCGAHETSPRFTCAGCHVGNGRFPKTPEEFTSLDEAAQLKELGNIDCLMCHQEQYKRFPDPKGEFEDLLIVSPGADGKPDPNDRADPAHRPEGHSGGRPRHHGLRLRAGGPDQSGPRRSDRCADGDLGRHSGANGARHDTQELPELPWRRGRW